MHADNQRKPKTIYNWGPETEPQLKNMYHGLGGAPTLAYTSNPVSWLVNACNCIPWLNITSGNRDNPVDAPIVEELEGFTYDAGQILDAGPGRFERGSNSASYVSPRSADKDPLLIGNPGGAVPLIVSDGGVTGAWGSRKTGG
jgi:hypothetical protein